MDNKGFTLVDLLIGAAIMLLVLAIVYNIYPLITRMHNFSYELSINNQDSRDILNFITEEISDATPVTVTSSQLTYTDKDGNSKIIAYDNTNKAVTASKGGTLYKIMGQGNISSLDFQGATLSNTKIKVTITVSFVGGDSITTTVMTMNGMEE